MIVHTNCKVHTKSKKLTSPFDWKVFRTQIIIFRQLFSIKVAMESNILRKNIYQAYIC